MEIQRTNQQNYSFRIRLRESDIFERIIYVAMEMTGHRIQTFHAVQDLKKDILKGILCFVTLLKYHV